MCSLKVVQLYIITVEHMYTCTYVQLYKYIAVDLYKGTFSRLYVREGFQLKNLVVSTTKRGGVGSGQLLTIL